MPGAHAAGGGRGIDDTGGAGDHPALVEPRAAAAGHVVAGPAGAGGAAGRAVARWFAGDGAVVALDLPDQPANLPARLLADPAPCAGLSGTAGATVGRAWLAAQRRGPGHAGVRPGSAGAGAVAAGLGHGAGGRWSSLCVGVSAARAATPQSAGGPVAAAPAQLWRGPGGWRAVPPGVGSPTVPDRAAAAELPGLEPVGGGGAGGQWWRRRTADEAAGSAIGTALRLSTGAQLQCRAQWCGDCPVRQF
ncbi:hypothetical protein D3C71_1547950 [compost metagenome]